MLNHVETLRTRQYAPSGVRFLPHQLAFVPGFFGGGSPLCFSLWVELGVERKFCVHGTYSILVEGICLT
jgi:hypothetical protein